MSGPGPVLVPVVMSSVFNQTGRFEGASAQRRRPETPSPGDSDSASQTRSYDWQKVAGPTVP